MGSLRFEARRRFPRPPTGKNSARPLPVSAFIEPESVGQFGPAREPPSPFQEPAEFHCGLPVESRICSAGGNENRMK